MSRIENRTVIYLSVQKELFHVLFLGRVLLLNEFPPLHQPRDRVGKAVLTVIADCIESVYVLVIMLCA